MSASSVQVFIGHHDAFVRMKLTPQLPNRDALDLGSVFDKDSDELSATSSHTRRDELSIQERGPRYSAPYGFSVVLHEEIEVVARIRCRHEGDLPPHGVLTGCSQRGSAPRGAA